jgi:16S rRNA (uracil1498-N3)-methyltransferase
VSRYDFDAPRLFLDAPLVAGREVALTREQMNYLVNVLRLQAGQPVLVFNGRDGEWQAALTSVSKKAAALTPDRQVRPQETGPDIDYLFAPLKHARLDYMVQKAVEMGARRLRPVLTRRTQVHRINLERMLANAVEAAEQCGILSLPEIAEPAALETVVAGWPGDRLLVFCDEDAPVRDPVAALAAHRGVSGAAVLIGPEGGFDPAERTLLQRVTPSVAVSLGPRILRADTAAVAALALVQAVLGDGCGQTGE